MSYPCGVSCLGVVLQDSGQAEVRHLTHQVAVHQDITSGQVSVDITHVRQVPHARRDATQHAHQLDHCELTIVFLTQREREREREGKRE